MTVQNVLSEEISELAPRLRELDRLQHPVWVFDFDNARIIWCNDTALPVWQAQSKSELFNRDMGTDMSVSVSKRLNQYKTDFGKDHSAQFKEYWTLYPNGEPTTLDVVFSAIWLHTDRLCMFCEGTVQNTVAAETLRSAEALLHTSVLISLYSSSGKPLYRNPASRSVVQCADCTLQEHFVDSELLLQLNDSSNDEVKAITSVDTVNGLVWHDITAHRCLDSVSGEDAWLISEVDVSKLKATEEHAQFLAEHDTLTKLPNRNFVSIYFQQKIDKALADGQTGALIFIDLDNFKNVNDSLGHDAGDQLLVEVSSRLKSIANAQCSVARLGGDEFLILINAIESEQQFEITLRQLIETVSVPTVIQGREIQITTSVGVALYPNSGVHILDLMRHADLAMYHAKARGKNDFAFFSKSLSDVAESKMDLVSELRVALKNNQFEAYFQPRVDVKTNAIVGAEALARWNHPTKGLIPPGVFISLCEECGLISELGTIIFERAIIAQRTWQEIGFDLCISVNLSAIQFNEKNLVEDLLKIVQEHQGNPNRIELEITESVLLGNDEAIVQKLHRLVDIGFKIAIDDFGTGYSNLAYLHRYPISCLKIDQSFISSMDSARPIIELIVSMAELFNLDVVAEGVETAEQLDMLRSFYCGEYQGYFYEKPIEYDGFTDLLMSEFKRAA